jgi:cell division protein FtsW
MKRGKTEFCLILIAFLLLGFGLVMVFSASYFNGYTDPDINDSYYYFKKQLLFALIGLFLFFFVSNIPYYKYRKWAVPILLICLILLILVPMIGLVRNGAQRWLGFGALSFQPSELVKIGMIVYIAYIMEKKQPLLDQFRRGLLPPLIVLGAVSILLMLQPHFSAVVIILGTCFTIIFCAGARLKHLFLIALSGLPVLIVVMLLGDYRVDRIVSLLNPLSDPTGSGYQIMQSLMAIGPGGLTGVGLGKSIQKLAYLPEAHTDFIFSILSEELGFIGGVTLIILFVLLIVRGILIAVQAPNQFGTLLATGIVTLIAIESIFNLGVVTALLPVTGVPLPLISYGGTALVFKLISLGILLNISRYRNVKRKGHRSSSNIQPVQL